MSNNSKLCVTCYKTPPFFSFIFSAVILVFTISNAFGQTSKDYLRLIVDTTKDAYAYVNTKGDTVIPFGKYLMCYTDTFDKFAIVGSKDNGLVGIDRNEKVLFNVYVFDNGPDYPSDGLFRIVKDGKIGYANLNGQIVIPPQFDCAYPFKKGKAKVGNGCKTQSDGEHHYWTGGQWYIINKKGVIVKV